MSSQKEVFLASEGDAWFRRNAAALKQRDWRADPVCRKLNAIAPTNADVAINVLEVGCGDGSRLQFLQSQLNCKVEGIDPSSEAVAAAIERGVRASQGTADSLPFGDRSFDVVIFGFCLYLCDDRDLFKIASEADRVLGKTGWLLILDFEADSPVYRPYHHLDGIKSRKMDYKTMFLWHPAYTLASHEKFHHETSQWTDDTNEWISLACLRKCDRR